MILMPSNFNLLRRSMSQAITMASIATLLFSTRSLYGVSPKSATTTQYTVLSLGVIDDPGSSAVVRRVNSLGEVVGGYKQKGINQTSAAFLLSATGLIAITDQQTTDFSTSYGIDDLGEIAGSLNGPSSVLPFRSVRHTSFQLLPLLPGDTGGVAFGIDQNGEAVGFSSGPSGIHAAWWTRKGEVTQLPGLPTGGAAKAIDINSKGDIAGNVGDGNTTAVRWPGKGGIVPLDMLTGFASSQAESINTAGDIVGASTDLEAFATRMHATLWSAGTTNPQDLGVLSGGTNSRARDVDDNDWVVGTGDSSQGNRAFLWSSASGMLDLNTLLINSSLILVDALSINSQGVILAIGIDVNDAPPMHAMGTMVATSHVEERELPRHIVLLTPVK